MLQQSSTEARGIFHLTSHKSLLTISISINASQVTMGRALRRTVHMFTSARDLVSESDRRLDLAANGEELSSTPE